MNDNKINADTKENEDNNKIELTIKYVAGNYTDKFNKHQTVKHVFDKAISHFIIDNTVSSKLGLFLSSTGSILTMSNTLESLGIDDGTILLLSSVKSDDLEG